MISITDIDSSPVKDIPRCNIRDEISCELADSIVRGLIDAGDLTPQAYANKESVILFVEDMIRDQLFTWEKAGVYRVERGAGLRACDVFACTCTTLDGVQITGSACPVHGLPTRPWSDT